MPKYVIKVLGPSCLSGAGELHIFVGEIDAQQSHQDSDAIFPHHPLQYTTPGHLLLQ